jgi:hypothetical protein
MATSKKIKKKKHRTFSIGSALLNGLIGVLSIFLIAFIYSISQKSVRNGVPMNVTFPETSDQSLLAVDIYEENPVLDIEVEVLNGCGITGVAGEISEFLRERQFDVVRSENADHFQYTRTLIIQRNENVDGLAAVVKALNIKLDDRSRVLIQPDPASDVDVTLIIGSDYRSIQPIGDFLDSSF